MDVKQILQPATCSYRAQVQCESGGGRPGLPVPNSPCGLCGRKATWNLICSTCAFTRMLTSRCRSSQMPASRVLGFLTRMVTCVSVCLTWKKVCGLINVRSAGKVCGVSKTNGHHICDKCHSLHDGPYSSSPFSGPPFLAAFNGPPSPFFTVKAMSDSFNWTFVALFWSSWNLAYF